MEEVQLKRTNGNDLRYKKIFDIQAPQVPSNESAVNGNQDCKDAGRHDDGRDNDDGKRQPKSTWNNADIITPKDIS